MCGIMYNMIIGFCGREGAGKSSAAEYITGQSVLKAKYVSYTNIWEYIEQLTGISPPIAEISAIIPNIRIASAGPVYPDTTEIMIAQPLKMICAALTGIPYSVMCGISAQDRLDREQTVSWIGLSCREILQKIGMLFRSIDENIWVNIALRRAKCIRETGQLAIISDVRFINEIAEIKKNGGRIIYICRHPSDLKIREADRSTHPSCWEFLSAYTDDPVVINDSTISNMAKSILEHCNL